MCTRAFVPKSGRSGTKNHKPAKTEAEIRATSDDIRAFRGRDCQEIAPLGLSGASPLQGDGDSENEVVVKKTGHPIGDRTTSGPRTRQVPLSKRQSPKR